MYSSGSGRNDAMESLIPGNRKITGLKETENTE